MPVGTVTKYNGFEKAIVADANRQWDDPTAGNIMFILAGNAYTPAATHATTSDVTDIIASGDGAPIAATSLAIDNTTTPGTTYFDSADANFGSAVTITAKYLICIQPTTANTYNGTTDVLLWWVDLDDTSSSTEVSSTASDFVVYAPANGWIKTV